MKTSTMNKTLALLAVGALSTGSLGCATRTETAPEEPSLATNPTKDKEQPMSSRTLVTRTFTALFTDFDVDEVATLLTEDYIQHNPGVPTGAAPVLGFLPALQESGLKPTTHRVLAEGDLVVLHTTYEHAELFGGDTLVGFDIFRVEGGKVAEHWDNLQAPRAQTASGRSMTDGPTEVVDLDLTARNKQHVRDFANEVLLGGQFDKLPEYIDATPGAYHQHNPDIADGLDGLGEGFAALAESGRAITYTKVHRIIAEGNFVFTMSEGTMGEVPTAFFDLFRLEGGKIVEHWDTIAAIPPASEMAHENGKF